MQAQFNWKLEVAGLNQFNNIWNLTYKNFGSYTCLRGKKKMDIVLSFVATINLKMNLREERDHIQI